MNDLEKKILGEVTRESAKLSFEDLPEADQKLYTAAWRILKLNSEDLSEYERSLLQTAFERMGKRILLLFLQYAETWCNDDPIAKVTLHERFFWFIQELRKEIKQQLEASEIEKNTPPDCEVDRVDEYFRKAPEVFTPESYDKLTTELMVEWMKTPAGKKRMAELGCDVHG